MSNKDDDKQFILAPTDRAETEDTMDEAVLSSAEDLRFSARAGDIEDVEKILNMYKGESNKLSKCLSIVLAASDSLSGNKALHFCAANGHLEIIRLLLKNNADINAVNQSGSTALHYAALNGRLEIVQELVLNKAKAVVENKYGRTALDEARSCNQDEVADFLLDYVERTGSAAALENTEGTAAGDAVGEAVLLESST